MGPTPEVAAVRRSVRGSVQGLPTGALVLVACSGGPDSVALAAAVAHEAPRAGLVAGAVTVDHGLQAGSAGRAAAVAEQLRGLGLDPVEVATVDGAGAGRRGAGPEAAARTARYRALDEAATRLGAAAVLLGHTRDDQAETVLLGLARGSGARSLAGMPAVRGRYRRPLLGLPRDVVRRAATGHRTWEDPHNADPAFARARARHDALPVLEKALGPGVAAALARSAGLLRADADALDGWARDALAAARSAAAPDAATDPAPAAAPDAATDPATDPAPDPATGDGTQRLAVDVLAGLPAAVRSRVLRLAALTAGSPASALGAAHVAAIDRLVTDWHGQGPLDLPGGVSAARACGTLALSRPSRRTDRHEH